MNDTWTDNRILAKDRRKYILLGNIQIMKGKGERERGNGTDGTSRGDRTERLYCQHVARNMVIINKTANALEQFVIHVRS